MDELLTSLNLDSVRGFSEKEIDQGEIPTQTAKDKVPVHRLSSTVLYLE